MTKAVFPGSFDPLTNGHLDIIQRASLLFDELVVVVGNNSKKQPWLKPADRVAAIELATADLKNVSVVMTDGLIVDLMLQIHATVIIRGVRDVNDFTAEKSLANFNQQLNPAIQTLLMPTLPEFEALSSSRVRELDYFNKSIAGYVPESIVDFINEKRGANEK